MYLSLNTSDKKTVERATRILNAKLQLVSEQIAYASP